MIRKSTYEYCKRRNLILILLMLCNLATIVIIYTNTGFYSKGGNGNEMGLAWQGIPTEFLLLLAY